MRRRVSTLATIAGLAICLCGPATAQAVRPTIDSEWVTGVTPSNATLHAEINPSDLYTVYKLQIDVTGHYKFDQVESCELYPPGAICLQEVISGEPQPPGLIQPPESSLEASSEPQHVSVDLASIGSTLQPETTYHYRAIAANRTGYATGPDRTFTTRPVSAPPLIAAEWATDVTDSGATLHAEIDPSGLYTAYKLQIDTTGHFSFYQSSNCVLSLPGFLCLQEVIWGEPQPAGLIQPRERHLASGYETQHVSVDLASIGSTLQPETTYHYRAIAENTEGFVAGPAQTFTTPAAPEPPPEEEAGESEEATEEEGYEDEGATEEGTEEVLEGIEEVAEEDAGSLDPEPTGEPAPATDPPSALLSIAPVPSPPSSSNHTRRHTLRGISRCRRKPTHRGSRKPWTGRHGNGIAHALRVACVGVARARVAGSPK